MHCEEGEKENKLSMLCCHHMQIVSVARSEVQDENAVQRLHTT